MLLSDRVAIKATTTGVRNSKVSGELFWLGRRGLDGLAQFIFLLLMLCNSASSGRLFQHI